MENYTRENRIRQALNIRGMKQVELCEKSGVNKSALNNWINQRWQPKQEPLYRMALALDVSEMWLAGYDVPMDRPLEQVKADELTTLINEIRKNERLKRLLSYLIRLNPDQFDTIESMVNQLTKINSQK